MHDLYYSFQFLIIFIYYLNEIAQYTFKYAALNTKARILKKLPYSKLGVLYLQTVFAPIISVIIFNVPVFEIVRVQNTLALIRLRCVSRII